MMENRRTKTKQKRQKTQKNCETENKKRVKY